MKKITITTMLLVLCIYSSAQNTGNYTDSRDGRTYRTVKIGSQVWMAENLCFKPVSGNYWAFDNNIDNIQKYGYLYDWPIAQTVCPNGWHLPSKTDFEDLLANFGGPGTTAYPDLITNGKSGMNLQFGGWRSPAGNFKYAGEDANLWSSTEFDAGVAYHLAVYKGVNKAEIAMNLKKIGLPVRCLKD